MTYLSKIIFIILILGIINKSANSEIKNEILFIINDNAYSSIDLENRKKYLQIINIQSQNYLKEYQTSILFEKEFNNLKLKIDEKQINNMYINIEENYEKIKNDNKLFKIYKLYDKKKLIQNITIDYKRKIVIELLLNQEKKIIFSKDLSEIINLYDIDIDYYSFDIKHYTKIKEIFKNLNFDIIDQNLKKLNNKNINYIYENKKIINTDNLSTKVKQNIIENNKEFIIKNNNNFIVARINKKIRSENNLNYTIIQLTFQNEINTNEIACNQIDNLKDKYLFKIKINKNINYSKLNSKLKQNLISKNDIVHLKNNEVHIYLLLCDINYDDEYFSNININQKINFLVNKIEEEFFIKKSSEFELIEIIKE